MKEYSSSHLHSCQSYWAYIADLKNTVGLQNLDGLRKAQQDVPSIILGVFFMFLQRLSLARLFLKKSTTYIFDESPLSLDKDTDFIIQNNIEKHLPEITKTIITHRPFLAQKVDQVITLQNHGVLAKASINQSTDKVFLTNSKY